ncbi:heterokaryon incompatibility protein-domain-containing protein, partial [Leptodontidium sp. MPI-SDFR-AT-0119]
TERPTRLIWCGDATSGESSRICLCDQIEKISDYLTTSHAWGKDADKLLKLTEGNLEDWKRQLPEKSLSQGFIDAIYVTRKLGFRYLWIDALCILQGCKQDWEIESGRIASYYKNAVLNIAATGYADGKCGFLENDHRDMDHLLPCRFYANVEGEWPGASMKRRGHYRIFNPPRQSVSNSPLNKRAWVIQERILSPRILHFERSQMIFECPSTTRSEQRSLLPERFHGHYNSGLLKKPFLRKHFRASSWHHIVQSYSSMELTFCSDKLVALSDLATEKNSAWPDQYLAGL